MKKLMLAILITFSVIVLPICAYEALPEGVKITSRGYFVYDLNAPIDLTGKIAPVAIYDIIEAPNDVKLKKEWLIGSKQDLVILEEKIPTKYYWKGLLPKSEEGKRILVRKFFGTDKVKNVKFEWQEMPSQEKTLTMTLIILISLLISAFLIGLSLRLDNKKLATTTAIIIMSMAFVSMNAASTAEGLMATIAFAIAIMAVVAAIKKELETCAISSLSSALLNIASQSLSINSLATLVTFAGLLALIFLIAWGMKIGNAK
jgi:hypothetical protein